MAAARSSGARRPMRVLILSDGVAGHDRSSLGILTALQKHRAVEAKVLPIRETRRLSRRIKRTLAGLLPFGLFWRMFYRIGGNPSPFNPLPITSTIPDGRSRPRHHDRPPHLRRQYRGRPASRARRTSISASPNGRPTASTPCCSPPSAGARIRTAPIRCGPPSSTASELPPARPLAANGTERHASILFGGQSKHYTTPWPTWSFWRRS